jgi:hypothetical protein
VDDINMILDADSANLFAAKSILSKFVNAIGLFINWSKPEARWLASYPCRASTIDLQWPSKQPHEPGVLLGFSFSDGLHLDEHLKAAVYKFKGRLSMREKFPLTLQGKVIVVNHL